MRSILKALGLTLWSAIAILLSVVLIVVAYHVAMKYRASIAFNLDEASNVASNPASESSAVSVALPERSQDSILVPVVTRSVVETRKLLMSAFIGRRYESGIGYGKELVERQSAEAGDLSIVAQAYFEISDCSDALLWRRDAIQSFKKAGLEPDYSLQAIVACCDSIEGHSTPATDTARKARIARLLSATDAAKSESGGPLVRLGELYYGFGQYELAVASIQRGLDKGSVPHLEDAYVYLGRSEVALGDTEAARAAFAKLQDVPALSPRVLRLWALYAEMLPANSRAAALAAECPKAGP